MDHKRHIEINYRHIQRFVVKHIGNPRKLGRAVFAYELKSLRTSMEELGEKESEASLAIRALSRVSYCIGMYSVDNVNTMPYGTCVKVMFGAFLACAEIAITKQKQKVWRQMHDAIGRNLN